ncbi:actin patch protein 1 [Saccharata proteae CBS 121410]|uniref:Actin patch protein 1 n=1 Tax=Saccharata proteae CBS 121410 TaxID=1314787 RepID=A0A9P4LWU2_9PEZI|nr:actin patch protein 1 [Saccharata proteae CBS 121410]
MSQAGAPGRYYASNPYDTNHTQQQDFARAEPREGGGRRKKLAGYLKAANELRQSYAQSYAQSWRGGGEKVDWGEGEDTPGAFPDAAIVRSGEEEMVLFPSYARKHVKRKVKTQGTGSNARDSASSGDAEYWKREWDKYEDDKAIVDVDVRGWIYSPHKGPMNRKHRIFISLARQLVGLPAPSQKSPGTSGSTSRDPSPHKHVRERIQEHQSKHEEELVEKEMESILRRGEVEADFAEKGGYSEKPPARDSDTDSLTGARTPRSRSPNPPRPATDRLSQISDEEAPRTGIQKRASWNTPANMSKEELAMANGHLMSRLKPFLANPLGNTPISCFFYNEEVSRQRTIYTDASGHFSLRAALEFVPTHVRILASEQLSATSEVIITEPEGVSLISDIDDTIKHSAISAGAREIFRNAFIRELGDLTIEGVREWYNRMQSNGVKFHYVSNSPWQLYPVISKFFAMAGLPSGSFHLKQYSGMLQGIFEPVAERKKATLDKLARDFPQRSFILVGDSGEADLEVYTDFVLENPGRVLGVFIRDVTTSTPKGFFDSSMGPLSGEKSPKRKSKAFRSARTSPTRSDGDVAELRPQLPPRRPTSPPNPPMGKLIDFSDDDEPLPPPGFRPLVRSVTEGDADIRLSPQRDQGRTGRSAAPMPPRKPVALRSPSTDSLTAEEFRPSTSPGPGGKAPPPKPRRPSTSVRTNQPRERSPLAQSPIVADDAKPELPPKPTQRPETGYAASARNKIASAYNSLPAASSIATSSLGSSNASTYSTHTRNGSTNTLKPTATSSSQASSSYNSAPASNPNMSKKEELWRRRWARAQHILGEKGVVLMSWRVGSDVMEDAMKLVDEALEREGNTRKGLEERRYGDDDKENMDAGNGKGKEGRRY